MTMIRYNSREPVWTFVRRDQDRGNQEVADEAIMELIEAHFDLISRLADSDLPVAMDAHNALEWYYENSSKR